MKSNNNMWNQIVLLKRHWHTDLKLVDSYNYNIMHIYV